MLDHWRRWMEACALGLCPADTRAALEHFVTARFRRYIEIYAHRTAVDRPDALMPAPGDAWQAFETWIRLRNTRQGKTYKLWLLAHANHPAALDQQRIESAATLLVRDAVREYLRRESSPAFMVSLDRTPGPVDAPDGASLHDLIPDPSPARSSAEALDLERMAATETPRALESMPTRERVACLARELGLPLSHPDVVQAAGCGKSSLSNAYAEALQSLARHVRTRFPKEDRSTQADLAIRLLGMLRTALKAWGQGEPAYTRLFRIAESECGPPLSGAG